MINDDFPTRAIAAILLLAAPAGVMYILSHFYDSPYLQPYDLDWKDFATTGEALGFARIDVHINWGRDRVGTMTQTELRDVIAATLHAQTNSIALNSTTSRARRSTLHSSLGPTAMDPFHRAR